MLIEESMISYLERIMRLLRNPSLGYHPSSRKVFLGATVPHQADAEEEEEGAFLER